MAGQQVEIVANQVEKQRLGYQAISLTNFASGTLEPQVAAGSKIEIGGALFEFPANESITGWSGIANNSDVYIHLTVAGASITASFSITVPTWDTAKQGWYSGSNRVIGGLRKDGSGNYAQKWLYLLSSGGVQTVKGYGSGSMALSGAIAGTVQVGALYSPGGAKLGSGDLTLARVTYEIGNWNMDSVGTLAYTHGLTLSQIRSCRVIIRSDAGALYDLGRQDSTTGCAGYWYVDGLYVEMVRMNGGFFDSTDFDASPYNRGWIILEYEP